MQLINTSFFFFFFCRFFFQLMRYSVLPILASILFLGYLVVCNLTLLISDECRGCVTNEYALWIIIIREALSKQKSKFIFYRDHPVDINVLHYFMSYYFTLSYMYLCIWFNATSSWLMSILFAENEYSLRFHWLTFTYYLFIWVKYFCFRKNYVPMKIASLVQV